MAPKKAKLKWRNRMKIYGIRATPKSRCFADSTWDTKYRTKKCTKCRSGGDSIIEACNIYAEHDTWFEEKKGDGFFSGDGQVLLAGKYDVMKKISDKFQNVEVGEYIIPSEYNTTNYQAKVGYLLVQNIVKSFKFKGQNQNKCKSCGACSRRTKDDIFITNDNLLDINPVKSDWNGSDMFSILGFNNLDELVIVTERAKAYFDELCLGNIEYVPMTWA